MEARRGEWLGSVIVAAPLLRWLLAGLAVTVAAAIPLFLVFGHYTRRKTVCGQTGIQRRHHRHVATVPSGQFGARHFYMHTPGMVESSRNICAQKSLTT